MKEIIGGQVGAITMISEHNRTIIDQYNLHAEARDLAGMVGLLATDAAIEFPQSGEHFDRETFRLVHQNFPGGLPKVKVERVTGRDDLWVVQHRLDYGQGKPWTATLVIELRDDLISHLTIYFGENFDVPAWRSKLLAERK